MKLDRLIVLLAEDEEMDVLLFKRAFGKIEGRFSLHVVENGADAISYLRGEGQYGDRDKYPFPTVLLLDLKMPMVDGLGVLEWLVHHQECLVIPALIFSSSALDEDIKRAYELRVNAYFTKPSSNEELTGLINRIFSFWCHAHVPNPPPDKRCA